MIRSDRWTGLFFVVLTLYFGYESWRLGLGDYHRPGAGFFPFYSSLVLGVLSLSLVFFTLRGPLEKSETWEKSGRILMVCLATLGFALLLERLGFIGTVFVFIVFVLRAVERRGWMFCAGAGLLTSAACFVVFQVWLKVQLPAGIFER